LSESPSRLSGEAEDRQQETTLSLIIGTELGRSDTFQGPMADVAAKLAELIAIQ
jgi:hypothetical protein